MDWNVIVQRFRSVIYSVIYFISMNIIVMCFNWSHYISDLNELIIWSICLYNNTDHKYLWYKYLYSIIMILIFSWNKLWISNTHVNYKASHNQYFLIYHYYSHIPKLCEFCNINGWTYQHSIGIFLYTVINNQYWISIQIFNSDYFGYISS